MKDSQMADYATEIKELEEEIEELSERKTKLKAKLVTEMERRGTLGIVTGGYKITYVQQKPVVYDEAKLKKVLDPKLFRKAQKLVFDPGLLGGLVQEGAVPLRVVNRCSEVVPKAAYVLINPAE